MSHTPTLAKYGVREDESIWFSIEREGKHNQFDYEGQEWSVAFIVKACNAHDELVAALKQAKDLAKVAEGMTGCRSDDDWVWGIQKTIDEALAKAGAL